MAEASTGNSARRADLAWGCLLVLASIAVWAPRTRGPIDLRWDAAAYYTLGTSITQFHDYRYLNEPGAIRTTQYPPGQPLFLSLHQRAMGTVNPVIVGRVLRATYFALYTVNMLVAFVFLRRFLPSALAAGLALISSLTISAIWLSDRAYADLPFAL